MLVYKHCTKGGEGMRGMSMDGMMHFVLFRSQLSKWKKQGSS